MNLKKKSTKSEYKDFLNQSKIQVKMKVKSNQY